MLAMAFEEEAQLPYDELGFDFKLGYSGYTYSHFSKEEESKSKPRTTNYTFPTRRIDGIDRTSYYNRGGHNISSVSTESRRSSSMNMIDERFPQEEDSRTSLSSVITPLSHLRSAHLQPHDTTSRQDFSDNYAAVCSKFEIGDACGHPSMPPEYYNSNNEDCPDFYHHAPAKESVPFQQNQEHDYSKHHFDEKHAPRDFDISSSHYQSYFSQKPADDEKSIYPQRTHSSDFVGKDQSHCWPTKSTDIEPVATNVVGNEIGSHRQNFNQHYNNVTPQQYQDGNYQSFRGQEINDTIYNDNQRESHWYIKQFRPSYPDQRNGTNQTTKKRAFTATLHDKQQHRGFDTFQEHQTAQTPIKKKKRRVKKTKNHPRRYLSAYNLFFSEEREHILAMLPDHGDCRNIHTVDNEKDQMLEGNGGGIDFDESTNDFKTDKSKCDTHEKNTMQASSQGTLTNVPVDTMDLDQLQKYLAFREQSIPKQEIDELEKKIKANTQSLLAVHTEGDRIKKSHKKRHGKIALVMLSKIVGLRWRDLVSNCAERKHYYYELARKDQKRYHEQMREIWRNGTHTPRINTCTGNAFKF